MIKSIESGRTLAETLGVLGIMTLLAVSAIKGYHFLTAGVKAQNTAKMIKTLAFERQNAAVSDSSSERTVKGPHSSLIIKNGTPGNHQAYFWVETTLSDSDFCEKLKESGFIQADLIEVDGVENGNCRDNSKIAFYFKKNAIANVYCPSHSTNCDTYGDATGCEEGYYLDAGKCSACGEHVATCEDENIATSCETGYLLYDKACISTSCTKDEECRTVCAVCDNGTCTAECSIPEPDEYNDCGDNECMVYDNATGTCQYACERKEYLESTGTQWIDTGYIPTNNNNFIIEFSLNSISSNCCPFGGASGSLYSEVFLVTVPNGSIISQVVAINNNTTYNRLSYPWANNVNYYTQLTKTNLVINGSIVDTLTVGSEIATQPIYLFARNNNGTADFKGNMKIRIFKTYDNDVLVRDFIPVSSPKGNCMFDRVTQKLFCNEATSGPDFLTN